MACGTTDLDKDSGVQVALQKFESLREPEPDGPALSGPSEFSMEVTFDGSPPQITHGATGTMGQVTPERRARIEAARAKLPKVPAPSGAVDDRTPSQQAVDEASRLRAEERISLTVEMVDLPFQFSLVDLDNDARQQRIAERQAQLGPSQDALETAIIAIGGQVQSRTWLSNVIHTRVPAGKVAEIARWPGVITVSIPRTGRGETFDGRLNRQALQLDGAALADSKKDYYQGCFESPVDGTACHDGMTGGRTTSPTAHQKIAIIEIEPGLFYRNHVGWLDTTSGPSRIMNVYNCDGTGCTTTSSSATSDTHGNRVAWAAAGSIEQGQDSNFPLSSGSRTNDQRARSGTSKEARILYFQTSASDGVTNAINTAVSQGADVINMSMEFTNAACNQVATKTYDLSGMNSAIRNAFNGSGVLFVKSAGNRGDGGGSACGLTYPAWRPEVLAVGGLNSMTSELPNVNDLPIWNVDASQGSSRGGATLRVNGASTDENFSGVGLMAPGCVTNWFNSDFDAYNTTQFECGTSMAAPQVAASAAMARDAWVTLGYSQLKQSWPLYLWMLLQGDGWSYDLGGKYYWGGIDPRSGFGRLHAHYPHNVNYTSPVSITMGANWMQTNNSFYKDISTTPLSQDVTQLKVALTWWDDALSSVSDITLGLVDTCDNDTELALDYTYDIRKRVHLIETTTSPAGKCPRFNVDALTVSGTGRYVFWGWDYHSGDPDQH